MLSGTCCFIEEGKIESVNAKSIKIEGFQHGLIVNFEVVQTFINSQEKEKEIHYIFPNDNKICIYDMTFVVGDEIIKPKLQEKEEAKKIYKEAVNTGHTAAYGSNIENGMTEMKLGNLPSKAECKVILKIAFTANVTSKKEFFIKLPLDVYNTSGSCGCLDFNNTHFSFQIQSLKEISNITSNIINGKFDKASNTYSIMDKIESHDNQMSIIITFETKEDIKNSALIASSNSSNYDSCALFIAPDLPTATNMNSEFIFVIDCSYSMEGKSIKKASECLELFIRSLPPNSYFNIFRFGSSYKKLFNSSIEYTNETAQEATKLAKNLKADLGCTELYKPLKDIFADQNRRGQRQIFIMTDGEIDNVDSVLNLIKENSDKNRCFTIGIGRGCDAGLVEGMANSSGGMSDFVQEGDSISEKVIPQLELSLLPSFNSIEIHLAGENNDTFEMSPYPLYSIKPVGATVVYLRDKKKAKSSFEEGILISGNYDTKTIEIPIEKVEFLQNFNEDKFGCSGGKNIGNSILPLFAFSFLNSLELKSNVSESEIKKAVEISISSGVLCKYTGYVGVSKLERSRRFYSDCSGSLSDYCDYDGFLSDDDDNFMCCKAASPKYDIENESRDNMNKFSRKAFSRDDDDYDEDVERDAAPQRNMKKCSKAFSRDDYEYDEDVETDAAPKRNMKKCKLPSKIWTYQFF